MVFTIRSKKYSKYRGFGLPRYKKNWHRKLHKIRKTIYLTIFDYNDIEEKIIWVTITTDNNNNNNKTSNNINNNNNNIVVFGLWMMFLKS